MKLASILKENDMGFSNCGGCFPIHNYEMAAVHWGRTPEPGRPGSQMRRTWDGARPLDDARKWHYRLEKEADFFDVCLYHTTMARYYKPLPDGSRCIEYTNHRSSLSSQFMWRVTHMDRVMKYGNTLVPIACKELGTTIWLDKDGRLIKEKSSHQPVYKKVTSPEQREWKIRLRTSTANLALMFELGIDNMVSTPSGNGRYRHPGRPFTGNDAGNRLFYDDALRYWGGVLTPDTTHEVVEALRALWESCLQITIDRRDYGGNTDPIKPKAITTAWLNKLFEKLCRYQKERVRLPDFPTAEQLPTKFYF